MSTRIEIQVDGTLNFLYQNFNEVTIKKDRQVETWRYLMKNFT